MQTTAMVSKIVNSGPTNPGLPKVNGPCMFCLSGFILFDVFCENPCAEHRASNSRSKKLDLGLKSNPKDWMSEGSNQRPEDCKATAMPMYRSISFEPSHEIMVLFVLRKLILQTRMRSHPIELDV